MTKKLLFGTSIILFLCAELPIESFAQSGTLDLTFGVEGIVTTPIGINDAVASSLAIQNDGKILVAGYSFNGAFDDFALARYNPDGSLDNDFGTDGKVTTALGANDDWARSIAIQSDGKVLLAGFSHNGFDQDFALVRYNSNGSLDNTFGTNGKVITPIGFYFSVASSLVVQSNEKIVVAGSSFNGFDYDFALVRYNPDGTLDNTFGNDGIVTTSIGNTNDNAGSVTIQNNGKIVVAGSSHNGSNWDFALVCYNTNGSLDNTFGVNGKVTTSIGTDDDRSSAIAIQNDGKIVLAGYITSGTNADFAVVRYNADGSIDNSFGVEGKVTTPTVTYDAAYSVALQSDGKILVAGSSENDLGFFTNDFALMRYNTNGSLDITFGNNGKVVTSIGTNAGAHAVALQNDGKILAAGYGFNGVDYNFAMARYNNILTTGLNTLDNQYGENKIYPNPFSTQTVLHTEKFLENATVIIYNSAGKAVNEIKNIFGQSVKIYRDNLPSGLYSLILTEKNEIISFDKLIILE